jgi:drug/metabolite transporter (DMT)-like permease
VVYVVRFAPGGGLITAAGVAAALVPQGDQAAQVDGDVVGLLIVYGYLLASTVTYLLPMVAIVLGVLVLSESVTVLGGIALVLAGVALTRRRTKSAIDERQGS